MRVCSVRLVALAFCVSIALAGGCRGTTHSPSAPTTPAEHEFASSAAAADVQVPRADVLPNRVGESFDDYVAFRPRGAGEPNASIDVVLVGEMPERERAVARIAVVFARVFLACDVRIVGVIRQPDDWDASGTTTTSVYLDDVLPLWRGPESGERHPVGTAAITSRPLVVARTGKRTLGEADRRTGFAVLSLDRVHEPWTGDGDADDEADRRTGEVRVAKLVVHELLHVFGLLHCTRFPCVVNAVGTVADLDARPLALCPDCLRKLQWHRGFDVLARYRALERHLRDRGHVSEARSLGERVRRVERSGVLPPR